MQQLTLINQNAKISNFNPRAEKNGEANVLAGDIKIETHVTRAVLDAFEPLLRGLLFRAPAVGEQPQLALEAGSDGATARRCPKLAPLSWDEKFPGYTLTIIEGMGLAEPLVIPDVTISGVTLEALDGGSVKLGFRASCHPDEAQSGALCALIQEDVELTLEPPQAKEPAQAELEEAA